MKIKGKLNIVILVSLSMLISQSSSSRVIVPNDGIPFTCYEFGLSDNSTWTFFDQCFSFQLNLDPFNGGLLDGKYAIVTDVSFTPTTETDGSFYVGVAQSTTSGNNFNPQIFLRGKDSRSLAINQTAPVLIISEGMTLRAFNSSTSPGSVRVYVQGYLVDDPTVNSDLIFKNDFE